MSSRKRRKFPKMEHNYETKRHVRPRLKLLDAPPARSIKDLIELGKTIRFYRNIDTVMLWRIIPYLEKLDNMVGMESLKETIFYQIVYYLQGMHKKNKDGEYLHTVIYGSPGTGKTTVAKIIGKLYQALNIISPDGEFRIATRSDLIAGYLGQTAPKTLKYLKSCLGGIVFIDEAYSLGPRNNDRDSFAKEVIDTLTGFLSEHKNDLCCIIAGYEEDVKTCFFGMNQGLERRFPWVHRIVEYSCDNLYEIFIKMIKEIEWNIDVNKKDVVAMFENNKEYFRDAGGDIETFLSKCKMIHSSRVFSLSKDHKYILTKEDLNLAMEFLKKNSQKKEDKLPHPMMYI